jgi:hypothetical protein
VVDARSFWKRKEDLAWETLEANNELPVRAILALWAYPEETDDAKQVSNFVPLIS